MTNACAAASARSSRLPFGFRLVILPRHHPQQDGPDRSVLIHQVRQMAGSVHWHSLFSSMTVTLPA